VALPSQRVTIRTMSHALDRFLEQYAFRHPVTGTRAGLRLHDHELSGWSREAREDELDEFEALTVALDEEHEEQPDDATLATDRHALEAHLARAAMDVRQLTFESAFFEDRNPRLWVDEVHDGIRSLLERVGAAGDPDRTMDDVASVAMRLHEVPRFLDDLPGAVIAAPASWRESALSSIRDIRQALPPLIDRWTTQHDVDTESVTWLREALETAHAALDRASAAIASIPDPEIGGSAISSEALGTLLTRGCFLATPTAVLLERATDEWQLLEPLLIERDAIVMLAEAPAHPLPAFATESPNRLGRLAALARPTITDALLGAWLTDAWSAYLAGFCDGDGELLPTELDDLPTDAIVARATHVVHALLDLRVHTEALPIEEASTSLQELLGVSATDAEAVVNALSMAPGRAIHAWFGAHALHQTRHVLQERSVSDHAAFAVRAMQYGAIPAPLLSRLLLVT